MSHDAASAPPAGGGRRLFSPRVVLAVGLGCNVLAYLLAAIVLIHIAGALRHHVLKRNDILRRMTWGMHAQADRPQAL